MRSTVIIISATLLIFFNIRVAYTRETIKQNPAEKKEMTAKKSSPGINANKKAGTSPSEKTGTGKSSGTQKPQLSEKELKKLKAKREKEKKRTEYIENTLDYGIQKDRLEALNRIKMIRMDEFRIRLEDKLVKLIGKEINPQVLKKAIYTAADMKILKAIDPIIVHIDNEDEDVAIASAYALKKLNGVQGKDKLIGKLKKQDLRKDSNLTGTLIQTLGSFQAKELITFAIEKIRDPKTTKLVRESFVLYLGRIEAPESKRILTELYKDPEEDLVIRAYAVNSLSKLGAAESTGIIKDVLKEIDSYPFKKKKRYYNLSIYSVAALVKLGDKSAFEKLLEALKSDNTAVRLKAISLIKEIDDERTVDILKYKLKYDPSKKVRAEAEKALKEIEGNRTKRKQNKEQAGRNIKSIKNSK